MSYINDNYTMYYIKHGVKKCIYLAIIYNIKLTLAMLGLCLSLRLSLGWKSEIRIFILTCLK